MSREGVQVEKERVEKECEYRRSARSESREGVHVEKMRERVEKEWVEKECE